MIVHVRPATQADIPRIHANLLALAVVEGRPDAVTVTPARLAEILFPPHASPLTPRAFMIERESRTIGHAWVWTRIPTFSGRAVLHLEDLYIDPAERGRGVGRAIMSRLAALALADGCMAMDWSVAEGNDAATRFYVRLGAALDSGSTGYRMDQTQLAALASPQAT